MASQLMRSLLNPLAAQAGCTCCLQTVRYVSSVKPQSSQLALARIVSVLERCWANGKESKSWFRKLTEVAFHQPSDFLPSVIRIRVRGVADSDLSFSLQTHHIFVYVITLQMLIACPIQDSWILSQ